MKLRLVVIMASGEFYNSEAATYTEEDKEALNRLLKEILNLKHFSITTDAGEVHFNPKYIESILVRKMED